MIRPATLRGRLALVGVLTVAAWVAVLTVAFNVGLTHRLHSQADDVLKARAEATVATVDVGPGGRLDVREVPNDTALDTGIWIYEGHRLVEAGDSPGVLRDDAAALAGRGERFQDARHNTSARLYALPVLLGRRQVGTIVAATSLDPYQRTARLAQVGSIALAALLLVGVYVMARLTVTRALAPVDRMAGQAAEWSAHDVTQRFGTASRPDELAALAASLDGLLDRLSAVLRHERQLSAELSHELRTPLAHIAAETELLIGRERSADELARAHGAIRDSTERMSRIIETLLLAARADTVDTPGRCAVDEVLASVVARRQATCEVSLSLSVEQSPLYCGVGTDILERIVGPVLDNAVRYATGQVWLSARRKEDLLEIEVGDDGPGLAHDDAELAFTAGWRGDPADLHDGAGLGLPLARRLARSVGGDVENLPAGHGATFVIRLPAG